LGVVKKAKRIKRLKKKLTGIAREIVAARDFGKCQWCGEFTEGRNRQASHVIPKSQGSKLRYDLQNLKILCLRCHIYRWHKSPLDAKRWFKGKFPERHKYLMGITDRTYKWTEEELIEKIEEYEQILSRHTGV